MGETQENGQNGQSPDLKYRLQLKTKEDFVWDVEGEKDNPRNDGKK